jgi:hypothetical protein
MFGRKLHARFQSIEIDALSPTEQRTQIRDLIAAMIEEIDACRRTPDRWEARLLDAALAHLSAERPHAAYDAIATILVPLGARGRAGRGKDEEEAPKTLPELRSRLFGLFAPAGRAEDAGNARQWKRAT